MAEGGSVYALLVGIDRYESDAVRPLGFATADVVAFRDLLVERFGLSEGNLILLANPPVPGSQGEPTRSRILWSLERCLRAPMAEDDTFLLHFSGHGFNRGDRTYLLATDSVPGSEILLRETAVSLDALRAYLGRIRAGQQLVLLDACRNEPTTASRGTCEGALGEAMARDMATLARPEEPAAKREGFYPGRAIVSACWKGQFSYEYAAGGHGWFCHNLLEEIRGFPGGELDVVAVVEAARERMRSRAWQLCPEAAQQTPYILVEGRRVLLRARPQARFDAESGAMGPAASEREDELPTAPPSEDECVEEPSPPPIAPGWEDLEREVARRRAEREAAERAEKARREAAERAAKARREAAERALDIAKAIDEDPATSPEERREVWERYLREFGDTGVGVELARSRIGPPALPWPSPPDVARRIQEDAAAALGVPVEQEIDIGKGVRLTLVLIPPGEFDMGSHEDEEDRYDDEGPFHRVKIEKPFWIGKFAIRQAEWQAVMGKRKNPSRFKGADNPVESVSWEDCQEFLKMLNAKVSGAGFRLPSEAEWEYACRAGAATRFCYGDDPGYSRLGDYAWYDSNSGDGTHPVGQKKPNAWGLHDMHGNVWEWCSSLYRPYPYDAGDGRENQRSRAPRVHRGGSWCSRARYCRAASRRRIVPENCFGYYGLRVARNVP